ncbi:MAG: hypothetical protein QXT06_04260 [Candidatus Bathyarchaeia archaeon]
MELSEISRLIKNQGRTVLIGATYYDQIVIRGLAGIFVDFGDCNEILVDILTKTELKYAIIKRGAMSQRDILRLVSLGFKFIYNGSEMLLAHLETQSFNDNFDNPYYKLRFKMKHEYSRIWFLVIAKGATIINGTVKIDKSS